MSTMLHRNHVTVAGLEHSGAPTMVFAHGFGTDQTLWRFVEPAFRHRYRTVLFDYVGSGRSDLSAYDPARYGTIDGYADDLLDICAALDLQNAVLVAHSFSSMVGVAAAVREPQRFSTLIMLAPNARFENDPPAYVGGFERADLLDLLALMQRNMVDWANFLAPVAMKNDDRPDLAVEFADTLSTGEPDILQRFARLVFLGDFRALLPLCTTPTLILQCEDDSIAPPSAVEYVRAHLPHGELRHMRATGHCPHVSHPQETIALIDDFLAARGTAHA